MVCTSYMQREAFGRLGKHLALQRNTRQAPTSQRTVAVSPVPQVTLYVSGPGDLQADPRARSALAIAPGHQHRGANLITPQGNRNTIRAAKRTQRGRVRRTQSRLGEARAIISPLT